MNKPLCDKPRSFLVSQDIKNVKRSSVVVPGIDVFAVLKVMRVTPLYVLTGLALILYLCFSLCVGTIPYNEMLFLL